MDSESVNAIHFFPTGRGVAERLALDRLLAYNDQLQADSPRLLEESDFDRWFEKLFIGQPSAPEIFWLVAAGKTVMFESVNSLLLKQRHPTGRLLGKNIRAGLTSRYSTNRDRRSAGWRAVEETALPQSPERKLSPGNLRILTGHRYVNNDLTIIFFKTRTTMKWNR